MAGGSARYWFNILGNLSRANRVLLHLEAIAGRSGLRTDIQMLEWDRLWQALVHWID